MGKIFNLRGVNFCPKLCVIADAFYNFHASLFVWFVNSDRSAKLIRREVRQPRFGHPRAAGMRQNQTYGGDAQINRVNVAGGVHPTHQVRRAKSRMNLWDQLGIHQAKPLA